MSVRNVGRPNRMITQFITFLIENRRIKEKIKAHETEYVDFPKKDIKYRVKPITITLYSVKIRKATPARVNLANIEVAYRKAVTMRSIMMQIMVMRINMCFLSVNGVIHMSYILFSANKITTATIKYAGMKNGLNSSF